MQKCLAKIVEVGIYWAKVKGRFRSNTLSSSGAEKRIYLAIKYGNIWRTKVLIRKIESEIKLKGKVDSFVIETNKFKGHK